MQNGIHLAKAYYASRQGLRVAWDATTALTVCELSYRVEREAVPGRGGITATGEMTVRLVRTLLVTARDSVRTVVTPVGYYADLAVRLDPHALDVREPLDAGLAQQGEELLLAYELPGQVPVLNAAPVHQQYLARPGEPLEPARPLAQQIDQVSPAGDDCNQYDPLRDALVVPRKCILGRIGQQHDNEQVRDAQLAHFAPDDEAQEQE